MTVVCIDIVCIIISYVHGGYIYICGCCLLCIAVYKHYNYLFFTWQYLRVFAHEKLRLFLWKIEDQAYKIRAGGNGPAAPVLAGPVFLKVKMKVYFYK